MSRRINLTIQATLVGIAIGMVMLAVQGCSQTIYDRVTLVSDPNGVVTIEVVHFGSTGVATDTSLDGLSIESGERRIALDRATEEQDSVQAILPSGVIKTTGE